MRTVSIDMALCDRIVRHVDNLRGLVPPRFVNLVMALFGRTWGEILMKTKKKNFYLTGDLFLALRCLDRAVLNILISGELPEETTIKLYQDFSTLKTLIS